MYNTLPIDTENLKFVNPNDAVKIVYLLCHEQPSKLKGVKYLFSVSIEILDVSTKIFYASFIKEFMDIMKIKNQIHELINKCGGVHASHIIDRGIIKFFYFIDEILAIKLKEINIGKYNCFAVEFKFEEKELNELDKIYSKF